MAKIGVKYPCFAPIATEPSGALPTYGTGMNIGEAVSANLTINMASGELYADDNLQEQFSEFSSGSIALETTDMTDAQIVHVYNASLDGGKLKYNKGDTPPLGCLAYYKTSMTNGVKKYIGYFYPKVRASLGNDSAQTKGNSITFQTTTSALTIFACNSGDWRITEQFDTEAAAKAWVETMTSAGEWHKIIVSINGADETENVNPLGVHYVADGDNFAIGITGTASKLYDNGVESGASIVGGVYGITSVAADHDIVVIF